MEPIEQAIFTSARTDRSAGYQVVAASEGVFPDDARELAAWCPSHDAMLDSTPSALSYNFHPLPSGAYCASRTTMAGREYSGRGARVYTHCLITPPTVLERFANNPFALLKAALAVGALQERDDLPDVLKPLKLSGRTPPVDSALLTRLAANPGADQMATLVEAALDYACLGLSGSTPTEQLVAGLINCLPPQCRTEFSFTTGLKFSAGRPFRVIALALDKQEQHRITRRYNVAVLDLSEHEPDGDEPDHAWARGIRRVLLSGRTSLLAAQFDRWATETALDDLHALGLRLLGDFDPDTDDEPLTADRSGGRLQHSHRGHCRFENDGPTATVEGTGPAAPSTLVDPGDTQLADKLRRLDELVYRATTGRAASIEPLRSLWHEIESKLDDDLRAEAREQYLGYALEIWESCAEPNAIRHPGRAGQSLDVLAILFGEA